jgi:hypothetical protein
MLEQEAKKAVVQENVPLKAKAAGFASGEYFRSVFPAFVLQGLSIFKDDKKQLNIRAVNSLLFILIGMLTLYYANGIRVSFKRIGNINLGTFVAARDQAVSSSRETSLLKPFSFYLELVKKRDIFRMGKKAALESSDVISSKAAEASQTMKLVGISWSESPDAMIEDVKAGKTFFVKKGQLVGDFKVDAIYKDKVVLRYGAETIELR